MRQGAAVKDGTRRGGRRHRHDAARREQPRRRAPGRARRCARSTRAASCRTGIGIVPFYERSSIVEASARHGADGAGRGRPSWCWSCCYCCCWSVRGALVVHRGPAALARC
ncbi:MAG: hypothetical protein MZV63_23935 [Marinilabiliales bacterium]|nr:hypothetical protein [Marinilabiliales bacterium]